jgi:hypothetical protein
MTYPEAGVRWLPPRSATTQQEMNLEEDMSLNIIKYAPLITMLLLATWLNAYAGDLDDGIKADDKIEAWDTINRPDANISFIKRRAKASATRGNNAFFSDRNGDVAIGGFINQPGADFKGDVTIIFDGEDINAVSE